MRKRFAFHLITFMSLHQLCWSNLPSNDVTEGPCIENMDSFLAANANLFWFATPRNYYVPLASEGCYRNYAEALLGRAAKSKEELQDMKLRIEVVAPVGPVLVTRGFNNTKEVTQMCPPARFSLNLSQLFCVPLFGSEGTDLRGMHTSFDSIIYTDNESTMLIVRCLNHTVKDYKVLTTEPTVTPTVKELLAQKIIDMGFNKDLMSSQNY